MVDFQKFHKRYVLDTRLFGGAMLLKASFRSLRKSLEARRSPPPTPTFANTMFASRVLKGFMWVLVLLARCYWKRASMV